MRVVLTLPGEGLHLAGFPEVESEPRQLPGGRGLGWMPGTGMMVPIFPDSLDIGALEGWSLTFDQISHNSHL